MDGHVEVVKSLVSIAVGEIYALNFEISHHLFGTIAARLFYLLVGIQNIEEAFGINEQRAG